MFVIYVHYLKNQESFFSHYARISFTVQNAYFAVLWVQGRWRWVASNKFGSFRVEPWYTTSSDICHQYQVSILFGGRSLYKDVYQISCEFFPKLNSCSLCKLLIVNGHGVTKRAWQCTYWFIITLIIDRFLRLFGRMARLGLPSSIGIF